MKPSIQDWEALGVFFVLTAIWLVNGAHAVDWISAAAVFFGFLYAQLAFDIAEGGEHASPSQSNAHMRRLFVLKEATWLLTFAMLGSWPLLVGALMFIVYPAMRCRLRANPVRHVPPDSRQAAPSAARLHRHRTASNS